MVRLSFLVPLSEFKDQLIKQGHFHLKRSVRGDFSPDRQCATCKCKGSKTQNRFGNSREEEKNKVLLIKKK